MLCCGHLLLLVLTVIIIIELMELFHVLTALETISQCRSQQQCSGGAFFNSKIIFLIRILCLGGLWVGFVIVRVHNERVDFNV